MSGNRQPALSRSASNLVLIGYRGSGKTSVGRRAAERLGWPFVDTDAQIEALTGRTIREIFDLDGAGHFREIEAQVVAELARQRGQVLSVGGGAVLDPDSRRLLRAAGACVWLTAPPQELCRRLASDPSSRDRRPPLTGATLLDEIQQVLNERLPIYESMADLVLDTLGRSPDELADAIVAWLRPRLAVQVSDR